MVFYLSVIALVAMDMVVPVSPLHNGMRQANRVFLLAPVLHSSHILVHNPSFLSKRRDGWLLGSSMS